MFCFWLSVLPLLLVSVLASYYDSAEVPWNFNVNEHTRDPLEYFAPAWPNHTYQPSPKNWRFPFYSFFLDRFVNGDPSNDNANGTSWEHDVYGTQLRHGGDVQGLEDSLDYLHGLGIRGLYLEGSVLINLPWESDGYSPLDHTILDHHFGTIEQFRKAIQSIHDRGMYVIVDNTMSTMSNLLGFQDYLNTTAPFSFTEYAVEYTTDRVYRDFSYSNVYEDVCSEEYPRFWDQSGHLYNDSAIAQMTGCRDSEFDQYGTIDAFGIYPEWRKQLSKFNGEQDRLREWRPSVLNKINHFSCMMIQALDIDGFRMDKGMEITVDPLGNFSKYQRECAAKLGKANFFIPGEMVNGNADNSIYVGRGKEPEMKYTSLKEAAAPMSSNVSTYIRDPGHSALDAAAFQYSTYRALMRFLGLSGNLTAEYDTSANFPKQWEQLMETNDMHNAITGKFDLRHMYGASNQDVFRWPGMSHGTERQLLAQFITTLTMPGIPLINWGEEQTFYALDSTADNYLYGRQPMSSAQAWQMHGCYKLGDSHLVDAPFNSSLTACQDDSMSLDHRDPSHPAYGLLKQILELRRRYPVLNDGFKLELLSSNTFSYVMEGSSGEPTVTGLWSVVRDQMDVVQDLSEEGAQGDQPVWLLYSNDNETTTYSGDCDSSNAIIAPFAAGTTVKSLLYPFEELTLNATSQAETEEFAKAKGCLPELTMTKYGWKAFVPVAKWMKLSPVITRFSPGHDARIASSNGGDKADTIDFEFRFSDEMNCDSFKRSLSVSSTTESGKQAHVDMDSIDCRSTKPSFEAYYYGPSPSVWRGSGKLTNVYDGVHVLSTKNASNAQASAFTDSNDHFLLRIGQVDNPIVFPKSANYSQTLLFEDSKLSKRDDLDVISGLYINQKAAGADRWRFSLSFGATWSNWMTYVPGNASLPKQIWTGQKDQSWSGNHVKVEYWSSKAGSSNHVVEGDLYNAEKSNGPHRRFPHVYVHGPFNEFGYDRGLDNKMWQLDNGTWAYDFMDEWPAQFQLNVWGMASNGQPDVSFAFGDIDNDTVLDRIAPTSLQEAVVNITNLGPQSPYLAWRILFNDADYRYYLVPHGSRWRQLAIFVIFAVLPILTAAAGVLLYIRAFYDVKLNEVGFQTESKVTSLLPVYVTSKVWKHERLDEKHPEPRPLSVASSPSPSIMAGNAGATLKRRTVLVATMEYDISDWNIRVKIGGLGVMAQLMAKHLDHEDLVWVVPCCGDIRYPKDTAALPIDVEVSGEIFRVKVQYHKVNNITYVLLDAPIFRQRTRKDPYPARMDDRESAVYYSVWNQCIAEAIRRFPIDLYHINDYHGALAPLYLLPKALPCCLSLHNAEFQGLWHMRDAEEVAGICSTFNLPLDIVQKYVQFGDVFNLLHAGASILRNHQKGFGAVGVSKKYGRRSWARYPIFWGLKSIGALPNPDPSDTADWDGRQTASEVVEIDEALEADRVIQRRKAQEWAGLEQRSDAELFVFIGRWSQQKGIDLVADVFPSVLEQNPRAQLICVGPTIDLYGKFAALKLEKLSQQYPGRLYSNPEFTTLPPFIFSGAEFALIPSRDEPFGLVAVEFGRKGALGIGSRVGGLGLMPGVWYTIESSATKHHVQQFKSAISSALKLDYHTRAVMRARAAKQRFPVAQWRADLEILQSKSIEIYRNRLNRVSRLRTLDRHTRSLSSGEISPTSPDIIDSPDLSDDSTTATSTHSPFESRESSRAPSTEIAREVNFPQSPTAPITFNYEFGRRRRSCTVISHTESIEAASSSDDALDDSSDSDADRRREQHKVSAARRLSVLAQGSGMETSGLQLQPTISRRDAQACIHTNFDGHDQDLTPIFNDPTGLYHDTFSHKLDSMTAKNSESELCIEEYLQKAEKEWFNRLHEVKMGHKSPLSSLTTTPTGSIRDSSSTHESTAQFLVDETYQPPNALRRVMMYKIWDWPIYCFLVALGQILAASSHQITLLVGQLGQSATQLYVIASVYLVATLCWWLVFRRLATRWCLSLPWLFYSGSFLFLAIAPHASSNTVQGRVQYVAIIMYAIASASGCFFFAQNFGSSGAVPVRQWALRACGIQGTQQIYVIGLFALGQQISKYSSAGQTFSLGATLTASGIPIAVLFIAIGLILFFGLPDYYRQDPGKTPDFYIAIFRRKIIVWFIVAVFIQNLFLSAQYGRTWSYLFSSEHAAYWQIWLLIILFFVIIWALVLYFFSRISATHTWFIPLFAVALLCPRWAQELWATSGIGLYLPWAGSPLASALLGRSLFLWLGLLDSIQCVGVGMILLQTLIRYHVTFALVMAQVVGSIATMIARADGLNSIGPGSTFPNLAVSLAGLQNAWFWVVLVLQIVIAGGYYVWFRKEQLSKP